MLQRRERRDGPIREVACGLNLDHQHWLDDIEALGKTVDVRNRLDCGSLAG